MNSFVAQYFRFNRFLFLAIGLWPYQKSMFARVQFLVFYSILIIFIVFQFMTFVTADYTTDLVIKVLSHALFFICTAIHYNSLWINADGIRLMMEQIQHVYNKLQNKNEIAIMEKYGSTAELYTTTLMIIGAFCLVALSLVPIWPCIVDTFLPMNSSRLRVNPIMTEYFVDPENCFYLIYLHANVALFIGSTALLALGTLVITSFKHICGMFSIASFRIEKAMITYTLQHVTQKKEILIYKEIIRAIDIHRKAMEFCNIVMKNFERTFVLILLFGMGSLISSLVQIAISDNFENLLPIVAMVTVYAYMFLANCSAQEITDHNNHVFTTVYNVQWYVASLRIQKMLLFIMQRGTKSFYLIIGGVIVGSLETAAMLMSTSVSYFTVLYSLQ